MPKVYIAHCEDYEYKNIKRVVYEGINAIGGVQELIGSGLNVAVKPNLIKANKPEDCVTTHPTIMQAVLEAVIKAGNSAKIVESPSGAYSKNNLSGVYAITGMVQAAQKAGAELNDNFEIEYVQTPQGQSIKDTRILKSIVDADCVISVAKLKTHSMMTYTGATKNLYGVVPGLTKVEGHYRFPDMKKFAGMIVDIAQYVAPKFCVIDAVWGMEGEGPTAGNPRKIGAIIVSDSTYAADFIAGKIINLPAEDNPVLKNAMDRGLCSENDIELIGDDISEFILEDFAKPPVFHNSILAGRVPEFLQQIMEKWLKLYPTFNAEACVGCGVCVESCPNKAIIIKDKLPVLNKQQCISCFCCHEVCPKKAVGIKRPVALKVATKLFK